MKTTKAQRGMPEERRMPERIAGRRMPERIAGRAIVHNHIAHTQRTPNGVRGFRWWYVDLPNSRIAECGCGWSGLLHFQIASYAALEGKSP